MGKLAEYTGEVIDRTKKKKTFTQKMKNMLDEMLGKVPKKPKIVLNPNFQPSAAIKKHNEDLKKAFDATNLKKKKKKKKIVVIEETGE